MFAAVFMHGMEFDQVHMEQHADIIHDDIHQGTGDGIGDQKAAAADRAECFCQAGKFLHVIFKWIGRGDFGLVGFGLRGGFGLQRILDFVGGDYHGGEVFDAVEIRLDRCFEAEIKGDVNGDHNDQRDDADGRLHKNERNTDQKQDDQDDVLDAAFRFDLI